MSKNIADKFADRIVNAGSSIAGKIAQDRVRDNFASATSSSSSSSFSLWDIGANTIAIIAFVIGIINLPFHLFKSLILIPILLVIFIFDLPSLLKAAIDKMGGKVDFLNTVSEKLTVVNQQTKGLIYIIMGILVLGIFGKTFAWTGIFITIVGGLHVYIHRFLKNGPSEPDAEAQANQF